MNGSKIQLIFFFFLFSSNIQSQISDFDSDFKFYQEMLLDIAIDNNESESLIQMFEILNCIYKGKHFPALLKNDFESVLIKQNTEYTNPENAHYKKNFRCLKYKPKEDFQGFQENSTIIALAINNLIQYKKKKFFINEKTKRIDLFRFTQNNPKESNLLIGPLINTGIFAIHLSLLFPEQSFYIFEVSEKKKNLIQKNIDLYKSYFDLTNLILLPNETALNEIKNSFGKIIINQTLHHLEDPSLALKQIYKLMEKDAELILFEPTKSNPAFSCPGLFSNLTIKTMFYENRFEELTDASETISNEGQNTKTIFLMKTFKKI